MGKSLAGATFLWLPLFGREFQFITGNTLTALIRSLCQQNIGAESFAGSGRAEALGVDTTAPEKIDGHFLGYGLFQAVQKCAVLPKAKSAVSAGTAVTGLAFINGRSTPRTVAQAFFASFKVRRRGGTCTSFETKLEMPFRKAAACTSPRSICISVFSHSAVIRGDFKFSGIFIGMVHAFQYMGIPRFILTDNMKSVVLHRDLEGRPVWQKDYETFMKTIGFETKLCKPRHPFTKGKVERLVRFVKENFLADRVFYNITDLNWHALEWCNSQNGTYHRAVDGVP